MGATYTRQSTYTDGDTITADHTNDEFDQLLAAFAASTGHTHDGTAGEGGPISTLGGHAITFGSGTAGTDIVITFDGESNDGVLTWNEDLDYFEFSDDLLIASTEKIQFGTTANYINSGATNHLDLVAGAEIHLTATDINIDGAVDVSGNLSVGGNLDVTGSFDMSDANITNIGSIALDTITNDGTDITLDSSGDIILDAGGANVTIKDDGTSILDIANNSSDVELTVSVADKNFKIKGTDSSSAITALDIDMALAGKATFNGDVVIGGDLTITGDDLVMGTNTSGHILVADGTNFNPVAVGDLSEISTVANDDVFLAVDTSGGGLKKITRSAVVSGLATSGAISNVVEDTSPQLGANLDTNSHNILIDDAHFIGDENGNEQIIFQTTSSAVNQLDITNAATGNGPTISSTGGDTNINLNITPKGSGQVVLDGNVGVESGLIDLKNSGSRSQIKFYCESGNAHAQTLQAAPHSESASNTLTLPSTGGDVDLVSTASTATLTNKTLTSPLIGTSILPVSADGTTLGSADKEFSDLFLADGGTIQFGNDQEIILTHVADNGLTLKHIGTGDGKMPTFTFQAGDNDIAANDELGVINFQAPDEGAGTDAILVAAGIAAVSEGDFSASNNATKLSFRTGVSEAASEKMSLSSAGLLTISDDFIIKDGGTIGSASDADAITIASDGVVTFSQVPVLPNNTIETADIQADAITGAKIADDAINSEHYTDGSIDTAHIADANVTQDKIANEAINEAKLQVSNAPTNGYFLTAQSGNTGGLTWAELSGIPTYTRSTTPPSSPNAGDWWVDTARGDAIYIYDGTSGWLSFGATTEYAVNGNFSVVANDTTEIFRASFQGVAVGSFIQSAIAQFPTGTFSDSAFGLSNSIRGVYGRVATNDDHLSYLTMATDAAAQDFGNLHAETEKNKSTTSHETRGIVVGGRLASGTIINVMDYITIASAGNATDFGNLSVARHSLSQNAMSSTTRSIFSGGTASGGGIVDVMDYVTIGTTGNATDFGNLVSAKRAGATVNSTTRGIMAGGYNSGNKNEIDYVTIGTTGNATDFGDLNDNTDSRLAYHSSTIAYLHAGVDQITMATAANATASGYIMGDDIEYHACMPGWIAYNG